MPIKSGNEFLWIKTNHRKLIASTDRQYFQYADDLDIGKCGSFKDTLVCDDPKLWFSASKSDCVWNIFNDNSFEKCVFEKSPQENIFIELPNNKMNFVCIENVKVTVLCNNSITQEYLSGDGVLQTRNCSIRGGNIHLDPPTDMNEPEPSEVMLPKIIVPEMDILQNKLNLSHEENVKRSFYFVRSNFSEIDSKLNETKSKISELGTWSNNYHDIHHYTSIYAILLILVIYLMFSLKKYCGRGQPSPLPAPRAQCMPTCFVGAENVGNCQTL